MRASVIIATFNRASLLDECLDHLNRQSFEDGDEVIVVDNGSTDATASVLARHRATFAVPLRHLEEPRPGKSIAVARALAVARGDVLVFTDDDVNVDPGWLAEIRRAMASGDVALVGGPVAPRWERPAPRWLEVHSGSGRLAAPLALLDYGAEVFPLGPRTVLGANMAIRHDVIRRVGGFAAHLGKLRGTLLSGEDHDLCRRVQDAGFTALYLPSAGVRHWVPASRVRLWYCLKWFFWSGITHATLDDQDGRHDAAVLGVPRYLIRRSLNALAAGPALMLTGRGAQAIERAIDLAFAAGYAARRWGLVRVSPSPAAEPTGQAA
jgi:glycosyltransferase involved in cell wall biosynthesis